MSLKEKNYLFNIIKANIITDDECKLIANSLQRCQLRDIEHLSFKGLKYLFIY